jgi:hypothetical protein
MHLNSFKLINSPRGCPSMPKRPKYPASLSSCPRFSLYMMCLKIWFSLHVTCSLLAAGGPCLPKQLLLTLAEQLLYSKLLLFSASCKNPICLETLLLVFPPTFLSIFTPLANVLLGLLLCVLLPSTFVSKSLLHTRFGSLLVADWFKLLSIPGGG